MRLKNKIKIFIFARGNSKGIKNKNLTLIKGRPLIYYSIKIAKEITSIENIYLSSDSDAICRKAHAYGVNTIKRPKKLALDKTPEILAWKHAIKHLNRIKIDFDVFVSLPPTSPLRTKKDVMLTIKKLRGKTDIVLTASHAERNPRFNMVKKMKNKFYDIIISGKRIFNRQQAPKYFDLNTVAFVTKPSYILKCNSIFDGNVDINIVSKKSSIDIDDLHDLKVARSLI